MYSAKGTAACAVTIRAHGESLGLSARADNRARRVEALLLELLPLYWV